MTLIQGKRTIKLYKYNCEGVSFVATAEHIKNLIKAHIDHNDEKFKTIVLQIAASEARHGHENIARDLKVYAEKIGKIRNNVVSLNKNIPMLKIDIPSVRLSDLILSDKIMERVKRILIEFRNRNKLQEYGLSNRRKILIEGNPGTGKTFTASVVASELGLPLYTVQVDKLVTKFMGETSVKLRQIFDEIDSATGVYFFDEFDAIGADRSLDNEVGEMRRILNSFLQFIEQDSSNSIIIAATNNQKLLDNALFRRFDDVLHYQLPSETEIERLLEYKLNIIVPDFTISTVLLKAAMGLSHAEIIKACDDAVKKGILEDIVITSEMLMSFLSERKMAYCVKEA